MLPHAISTKIVVSGNIIEKYDYARPVWRGYPALSSASLSRKNKNPLKSKSNSSGDSRRNDNLKRAKKNLRRIINANPRLNKFLTLTFADDIVFLDQANPLFNDFVSRIRRLFPDFAYVCVPEFQGDYDFYGRKKARGGRVHYHLLCNLPFVDIFEINRLWGRGIAYINKLDYESIPNVGAYIAKYVSKDLFSDRYRGKKKYFVSRNLDRPFELINADALSYLDFFDTRQLHMNFHKSFPTPWVGDMTYSAYVFYKEVGDESYLRLARSLFSP